MKSELGPGRAGGRADLLERQPPSSGRGRAAARAPRRRAAHDRPHLRRGPVPPRRRTPRDSNELEGEVVALVEGGRPRTASAALPSAAGLRARQRRPASATTTSRLRRDPAAVGHELRGGRPRIHRRGPDPRLSRATRALRGPPAGARTAGIGWSSGRVRPAGARSVCRTLRSVSPKGEPALDFGLDRQFGGHLGLQLQLSLGHARLGVGGIGHERVPVAALVVVDEVRTRRAWRRPRRRTRRTADGRRDRGLDRAGDRVDAHREVFHAGRARRRC